jgi:hypothetical protein
MKKFRSTVLISVFASTAIQCGKSDSETAVPAAVETVASGDQPDSEAGRYTAPTDVTAPIKPSAFSVAGGGVLGDVLLMLGYPDDIDDYARIDIRRSAGAVAPADCESGTVVTTITDFTSQVFTDAGLYPGSENSYLACVYDSAGNVIKTESLSKGRAADRQRIFVTSAKYSGNLKADFQGASFTTGVAGADARCQYHADQANLAGSFRAVLGGYGTSARRRLPIFGGVFNLKNERVASNLTAFWSGRIDNHIRYDENGTRVDDNDAATTDEPVWAGLSTDGRVENLYTCSDWSSTAAFGSHGYASIAAAESNSGWIVSGYNSCTLEARLYCLEVSEEEFTIPTLAVTAGATTEAVNVAVDVDSATVSSNMHLVSVFREPGSNFSNFDCFDSSVLRQSALKKLSASADGGLVDVSLKDTVTLGEHGFYHYYACGSDSYGNVRGISSVAKITIGTNWLKSFVTAGTFDGATLSLAAANSLCSTESSGLGFGTFKAFLTEGATTAKANVGTTAVRMVYDLRENYVGRITSGGNYEIFGQIRSNASAAATSLGARYWTGSYYYGTSSGYTCSDWTTSNSNSYGSTSIDNGRSFTDYWGTSTCNTSAPVACIQAN